MPRHRILHVFCRYLYFGGEELSVRQINDLLEVDHDVIWFDLDNREWAGPTAPSRLTQAKFTLYNPDTRDRFERAVAEHKPDVAVFHNIYPVGSPSLYHAASRLNLPVIQFAHNYRPFSVNGSLFVGGRVQSASLKGNYWGEIAHGSWQNSILKTAILAQALKRLRRSGWLDSVRAWVCVSEFMSSKFIEAGVDAKRVLELRHCWEMSQESPSEEDNGYYLFLGRLVEEKGVKTLLAAWDRLQERLGAKAPELWVAGEGPLEHLVKAASARNPQIKAVGMLKGDAKKQALRACRAVVVPSVWWEPFGLVVCESYDHGKPVLAAASGGLTETVQDGITGFLHQPGDVGEIVNDVIVMESLSQENRKTMGLAGREWLSKNAGADLWRQKFTSIVARVLQK